MNHPDSDVLAGLALGEDHPEARVHVEGCAQCASELARTRDVLAATARLDGQLVVLEQPPDRVWDAIEDELREPSIPQMGATPAPVALAVTRRHPLAPRRWSRAASAAAGFAVGIAAAAVFVVATRHGAPPPEATAPPRAVQVARGQVAPFTATSTTSGTARIVQRAGVWQLQLTLHGMPHRQHHFVQAWLLDPRTNAMIAVGVVEGDRETFPLPSSADLRGYTSVDISLEPVDGNPAHSKTSLARGALVFG